MTAGSVPAIFRLTITMNSGTTASCVGTASVAMTKNSRPFLPLKRSFEKA